MYHVYFLWSNKLRKYYTGSTDTIERRVYQHNHEKIHYTRTGIPWVLIGYETYNTKSEALAREKWIKKMKSKKVLFAVFHSHGWTSPEA